MIDFDEILVPVDGSPGAHRAALFGAHLAATLGVALKLTYVVPLTSESVMALAKLDKAEIEQLQQQQARSVLDQAGAALAGEGVGIKPETLVLIGDAAEEILHYVNGHPKTLVVMGRRGLSPLKSLVLGSVSEKVMRYAQGAVTLIN